MDHRVSFKVYYEDTDSLGIVYYANYLKYMERGRSEFLEACGTNVAELNRQGFLIVVHAMHVTYRKAAGLADVVDVVSRFSLQSRYRGTFHQRVERAGDLLVEADVEVVCLDPQQQLISFPPAIAVLAG